MNNNILSQKGSPNKNNFLLAQIIFWLGYYLFYSIFEGGFYGYTAGFLSTAVSTLFTIIIFYVHALYLFPELFKKKKYVTYFLYSLLLLTVLVALRLIGEYLILSGIPMFGDQPAFTAAKIIYRFAMGIITMVVSVPIKYMFDYFQLQAKQQQIINQQLDAEMKYLKQQINPHFLFNTLNNLLYLTKRKSDAAPGVVEKLANLMRYMLEKEKVKFVPMEEELEFIKSYLELEKIRIPKIDIDFKITGKIENRAIPPMLLIPLVENAFKHGVDKSSTKNFVKISSEITGNQFNFRVENPLLKRAKNEAAAGIGLQNLKKRLLLLYNGKYRLNTYITEEKTFVSELSIQLNEN